MTAKIAWAIDSDGKYLHIKHVPNGKACNCRCIECNELLIAYNSKSSSKTKHFGHEQSTICRGESVIHKVAKSILIEFAAEGQSIVLPGYYATSTGVDCLGGEVASTFYENEPRIKIISAKSEVRFGNIIIDSVIRDGSGQQFGVEIFVTNAKNHLDKLKFAQLDFEVFEINLSDVSWDVDLVELRTQLIRKAKRLWVNEAFVRDRCLSISKSQLPTKIEQKNLQINSFFKFEINNYIRNSASILLPLKPLETEKFTLLNGLSYSIKKSVGVHRIRHVTFSEAGGHASAEADILVDGNYAKKQTVPVVFVIGKYTKRPMKPTLVYQLLLDEEIETLEVKTTLCGISRWKDALEEIASREMAIANVKLEESAAERNHFLHTLLSNSDEIHRKLVERYSVDLRPTDVVDDGWNMPAKLWAPFFCEFLLSTYCGKVCSVLAMSSDDRIVRHLKLSGKSVDTAKRTLRIRTLLLYLYKIDVVTAIDEDTFSIPQDFPDSQKVIQLLESLSLPSSWGGPFTLSFYK